jgi:oxygen-independent coproporphyrinogen III oxidase
MGVDLERLAEALARPVPRYTSYPTAPQFTTAVGPATYAGWLAGIAPDAPLSLYLHLPYCRRMCWYCACHTRVANDYDPVARTRDGLLREIATVRRHLDAPHLGTRRRVSQIHWGGGTPTILAPEDFRRLDETLRAAFDVDGRTEIAVEIDPRTLPPEMVDALAASGVTRVSFGVQDFDPDVQRAINRIQSFETTRDAIQALRRAGVGSVNLDLLYGLPRQTVASVRATIEQTLALAPDRIALFGYAHVPWMKAHQQMIRTGELPGPVERWQQAAAAAEALTAAGYVAIGIDHFARPDDKLARAAAAGTLHRNFQGYTTDDTLHLVGLGASSISALPVGYAQNVTDVKAWLDRVESDTLATARGVAIDAADRLRAEVIERIMCDLAVDLAAVAARHGTDAGALADTFPALESLARDGIAEIDGAVIRVTEGARPLARLVAAAFDAYLDNGRGKHSAAV